MSLSCLPLIELLSNADYRSKVMLLAPLDLLSNRLICLVIVLSPLTVADDSPFEAEVMDLFGLYLSCLCLLGLSRDVLGTHLDVRVEHGLG